MAKLKTLVKQLSEQDFQVIYDQLLGSSAEKSAHLLRYLRQRQLSDQQIMEALDVNTNAYYTLRSRLNQKIEEYLLQQMENPRTDLLRKVANIGEVVFSKKRAISVATLKKLEKELKDYDLANELTVIYKHLKRLHQHTPEGYTYSQLYNRHIAYMLALDKAEDLLAEYFRKYGNYCLGGTEIEKLELTLLRNELVNVCQLYESHRLSVYQQCCEIFHRIFVEEELLNADNLPAIEDVFANMETIFDKYYRDSTYFNLQLVFDFLKLEYYNHTRNYRKAEQHYEQIQERAGILLGNYFVYTYPVRFLMTATERAQRNGTTGSLYGDFNAMFADAEIDPNDLPRYLIYVCSRALGCFYVEKYDEARKWLVNLLNELSLKKYPMAQIEVKLLLCLQYAMQRDEELLNQNINSIQRQIRLHGADDCEHAAIFIKMLKASMADDRPSRPGKVRALADRLRQIKVHHYSPVVQLRNDEAFIQRLL